MSRVLPAGGRNESAEIQKVMNALMPPVTGGSGSEAVEKRRRAIARIFGGACPLLSESPVTQDDLVGWVEEVWSTVAVWSPARVHAARHHRLFRRGDQWISSNNKGPWRKPPKPLDAVRAVFNMVGPALDWRLQVQMEQRPGIKAIPASIDADDQRRANAANAALEHQYRQQNFDRVQREAMYWAQTDGVAFIYNFWNPEKGEPDESGAPLGDIDNCIYRIEQVRVSPGASSTKAPQFVVVNEIMPLATAVAVYGDDVADEAGVSSLSGPASGLWRSTIEDPSLNTEELGVLHTTETVERRMLFVAPIRRYLPKGLALVTVGNKVAYFGPLLHGRIPIVRVTDGSSDPSYFPVPIMELWVDDQRKINAIFSKWIESIRRNSGGRVLAKQNALIPESLSGASDVVLEFRTPGSIDEVVRPVAGFSIGEDAKEAMQLCIARLEYLSGYNDSARGNSMASASGRAILANREQLERVFAPPVFAMADACQEWAKGTLAWMAEYYDVPRRIATLGRSNPLLGKSISSDDIDPAIDIFVDPETMMPMPRSLKLYLLEDQFAKGLLTPDAYREKLNFALTNELVTADSLQEAYAMRIVDAIKSQQPVDGLLRVAWQLDEHVVQDVLEREILLSPDAPPEEVSTALVVWDIMADQAASKSQMGIATQGMPGNPAEEAAPAMAPPGMAPPAPAAPQGPPGVDDPSLSPEVAPTSAMPPSGIPTQSLLTDASQEDMAARLFEQTAAQ